MSFRLFIWYCTLAGAGSALLGWALGRVLAEGDGLIVQGLKGFYLGLALALALALVDALWNFSLRRLPSVLARVICALCVGGLAGLLGGLAGEFLYRLVSPEAGAEPGGLTTLLSILASVFLVLGYTLVGLLIGVSVGTFDLLAGMATSYNPRGALRKVKSGLLGGTVGGILGGIVSLLLRSSWGNLFEGRSPDLLWSPSATAFAALGACIGLMIGLAQVILKQAWLRVEAGFRPGRELILTRDQITIGRAENCDVGLFGDAAVDKLHARIIRQGTEFILDDAGSTTGTYVNDMRLTGSHVLRSGDLIRVGRCLLRFGERTRKNR
jgi:hypothetical protein